MYHTIVVGGGISGLSTAISIKENSNKEVLLIEKDKKRRIRSSGGISKFFLDKSGYKPGLYYTVSKIYSFEIISNKSRFYKEFNEPVGYVLDQEKFEEFLELKALKLGVNIIKGEKVKEIKFNNGIEVNRKYKSKYLVGADGVNSIVRSYFLKKAKLYKCYEAWFINKNYDKNKLTICYSNKFAPKGYIWIFPHSDFIKIGCGVPIEMNLKNNLKNHELYKKYCFNNPIKEIGGLVPIDKPLKKLVFGNIALVGDSANQVFASTGGGIHLALICGKYLGEALAKDNLSLYQKFYEKNIYNKLKLHYFIGKILFSLKDEDYDRIIKKISKLKIDKIEDPVNLIKKTAIKLIIKDYRLLINLIRFIY
jgi:flavin-dependent dehydrogenase